MARGWIREKHLLQSVKNLAEASEATVKTVEQTKAVAAARKVHDTGFRVYKGLYRSLRDDFEKIASFD